MQFTSHFASLANAETRGKPNEDVMVADDGNGIYLIADGVTSTPGPDAPYPVPSGGQLAARAFAAEVFRTLRRRPKSVAPEQVLCAAVARANRAIFRLNQEQGRYADANFVDRDYMGTVGTAALVIGSTLHLIHIGDGMALVQRGFRLISLTRNQTAAVAEYGKQVRENRWMEPAELMVAIRRDFRNHPEARGLHGQEVAYGVLTGEPGALNFLQKVEMPLIHGDTVLLLTDGFSPLVQHILSEPDRRTAFCRGLAQVSDPVAWIVDENDRRAQRLDDRTVIVIRVE